MSEQEDIEDSLPEMIAETKNDTIQNSKDPTDNEEKISDLEEELLNHLAKSKAVFKSQQKGDPDLTFDEKLQIARSILQKSRCLFLSKFGNHLKQEHLKYFEKSKDEDYEVSYHINRLQRYFNESVRQIDVKNRRYQALKVLIEKGEYFSESEMMKRNPLLYEHLVGQYMTEEQKKARDSLDKNTTFVNLLMASIERDGLKEKQKLQEEEERNVLEERDSDEESDEISIPQQLNSSTKKKDSQWGEVPKLEHVEKEQTMPRVSKFAANISKGEKQMLKEEFLSNMYQSFLDGKDLDFDYSTVDGNEAYDNIDLRTQDEEEKYFDSESPETIAPELSNQSESEDELDTYMKSLKEGIATNTVSLDNQT